MRSCSQPGCRSDGSVAPAFARLQIIRAGPDVCRPLAGNPGCLQSNVGRGGLMLSVNPGREWRCLQVGARMFAGRYTYRDSWEVSFTLPPGALPEPAVLNQHEGPQGAGPKQTLGKLA